MTFDLIDWNIGDINIGERNNDLSLCIIGNNLARIIMWK